MKVIDIQKPEVFFVETDEKPFWSYYIRTLASNGYVSWNYLDDYKLVISPEHHKLLEEAYIDAVEERFNGCN